MKPETDGSQILMREQAFFASLFAWQIFTVVQIYLEGTLNPASVRRLFRQTGRRMRYMQNAYTDAHIQKDSSPARCVVSLMCMNIGRMFRT